MAVKSVMVIPLPDKNHIFIIDVDTDKKKIWYRRAFNMKHKIEEYYEVHNGQVRTSLIYFDLKFLDIFLKE